MNAKAATLIQEPPASHAALAALSGVCGGLVVLWALAGMVGLVLSPWSAPDPARDERVRLASLGPGENLDVDVVAHGKSVFLSTCAGCHGPDARGMANNGKNLATSEFVAKLNNGDLGDFVKRGRPVTDPLNTTKVDMPPRGGNADLSDDQLGQVIAFLRALQQPRRVSAAGLATAEARLKDGEAKADAERAAARAARLAEKAAARQAASAGQAAGADGAADGGRTVEEEDTETIAFGGEMFASTCSTCHGGDAKGLPNNGKDLVYSAFTRGLSDEELIAFVKRGRGPDDPASTTKILMPPKGGNPALSDERLEAIVAYIRSLQKSEPQ